ncbi:hypothetical protein KUV85_01770 [Nocardioides panacisoli]|uniref:hypothetical protein n=1 Tax=Nocardioides panacisoli TaxID=627624 RepID=UPI001C62FA6E|nr:hypothetical protein [Nocardioides panacisoli]QYJ04429.1 hypothetical protein KUV85_01770 [Nocardioides panacisoli]
MDTTSRTATSRTDTAPQPWLRPLLAVDAAVSGVNGVAYLLLAPTLSDLLGPADGVLRVLGAFLVLWGGCLAALATRPVPPRALVREVAHANLAWVAGSLAAALGLLSLTGIGLAWCLLQAVVVLGFAADQVAGSRR